MLVVSIFLLTTVLAAAEPSATPMAEPLQRLILVGDTGYVAAESETEALFHLEPGTLASRMQAAVTEDASRTHVILLGDVYYSPSGENEASTFRDMDGTRFDKKHEVCDLEPVVSSRLAATLPIVEGVQSHVLIGNHEAGPSGRECDTTTSTLVAAFTSLQHGPERVIPLSVELVSQPHWMLLSPGAVCLAFGMWREGNIWPDNARPQGCEWAVAATHHVYSTAFDKLKEQRLTTGEAVEDYAALGSLDLWVNGHAHQLEGGVYPYPRKELGANTNLLAITSGAGAKYECPTRGVLQLTGGTSIVLSADEIGLSSGSPKKAKHCQAGKASNDTELADWYAPGLGFTVVDLYENEAWVKVVALAPKEGVFCMRWVRGNASAVEVECK